MLKRAHPDLSEGKEIPAPSAAPPPTQKRSRVFWMPGFDVPAILDDPSYILAGSLDEMYEARREATYERFQFEKDYIPS